MRDESQFEPIPVPNGKILKEARILKTLSDYDILINMPICKEHSGNAFCGSMKNLMGLNSPESCQTFHKKTWTLIMDDIPHLEQSIADLNTVIQPDLCVVDATEFIITHGPFGPGEIKSPWKVVAGTDHVAIDAYCCQLFGLVPKEVLAVKYAHQHGIGEMDLSKLTVKEVEI
jgi:uncharacterized protein (DUF362 family)